jgi:hypothetical protein
VKALTVSPSVEAPPPVPEEAALPPRAPVRSSNANDGNYFVNCLSPDGTTSSGVAYYANLKPGGNVNQQPDDYVDVAHGSNYVWEQVGSGKKNPPNDLVCCSPLMMCEVVFPKTKVAVHWSIFGGSQGLEINASAGTSTNGFQNFWIYKDSGTFLYSRDGWRCDSIYFAF